MPSPYLVPRLARDVESLSGLSVPDEQIVALRSLLTLVPDDLTAQAWDQACEATIRDAYGFALTHDETTARLIVAQEIRRRNH